MTQQNLKWGEIQTFVEGEILGCSGLKYWAEGRGLREANTQKQQICFRSICSLYWAKLIINQDIKDNLPPEIPTSFHFQQVRIISDWKKLQDKINVIHCTSFRNHFLILTLLNTNIRRCFKDCNIFQRACRLVRLRTLTFTRKKSNEISLKILFFPTGFFF